jgi:hypothetical protein
MDFRASASYLWMTMSKARVLAVVALGAALGAALLVRRQLHWHRGVANVTVRDPEGRPATLDELRGSHPYLAVVFLAGDPASGLSAEVASGVASRAPASLAVVGVRLGDSGGPALGPSPAAPLAFPVYSVEPAALTELIHGLGPPPSRVKVGYRRYVERQPGAGISGGSVAIFDADRRLLDQAESPEVAELLARILARGDEHP